jgi:hypothetical protein
MRLGLEDEARAELELCYENEYRDAATVNTLRLMDSYKNFVTYKTDRTVLRLHKKEAELLHPYFEAEMLRALPLTTRNTASSWIGRCRWKSTPTMKTSPCAPWACPAWARWA